MRPYASQVGGAQRDHFLKLYLAQAMAYARRQRRAASIRTERLKRARAYARFNPESA